MNFTKHTMQMNRMRVYVVDAIRQYALAKIHQKKNTHNYSWLIHAGNVDCQDNDKEIRTIICNKKLLKFTFRDDENRIKIFQLILTAHQVHR